MSTSPSPAAETPPSTSTSPPPTTDTPPPSSSTEPPPEPNASPPPESSPPPVNPPPPDDAPPPSEPSTPPPEPASPPQSLSPPPELSTPPQSSLPPPQPSSPPQSSFPPPQPSTPPQSSQPPPERQPQPPPSDPPISLPPPREPTPLNPPETSPPPLRPPPSNPPESPPSTSRPPPAEPPETSPPTVRPPPSNPPEASPPPPQQPPPSSPPGRSPPQPRPNPPEESPSPPQRDPPEESPPLPPPNPPAESPPPPSEDVPPASRPPKGSPSPQKLVPPPRSPPSSIPSEIPPPPSGEPRPIPVPPRGSPTPVVQLAPPPPLVGTPPSTNPEVNGSIPLAPETTSPSSNGGIGTGATVAIGVVAGVLALGIFGLVLWVVFSRRKRKDVINGGYMMPPSGPSQSSTTQSDSSNTKTQSSAPIVGSYSASSGLAYSSSEQGGLGNSRSWFTYEEMVRATNGFSAQNLLGVGGFGSVYKGFLPDGRVIAVKRLKDGGGQGEKEFKAEVEIISRIHHRHLVSLVGYCIFEIQRLLVYDYVPNNTLYFHLHGESKTALDWAIRVKVAAGAARGIAYLHEDCEPRIIHRDIKSSNILLDYNFDAKVSDFGLAKLYSDANTHITTRVMGTFGYMAPEYASSGKLTSKSDVFSFGVVLLELITGRKPVDSSQPLGDESLVEWARPLLSHALETQEFSGLVDPSLGNNYDESQMFTMIEAAAACVRHSAVKRPSMGQIVRAFDSLTSPDLSNGMRPGQSEQYDSAQQSAEIRLFRRMAFGAQDYSTDFFSQESYKTKSEQP